MDTINILRDHATPFIGKDGLLYIAWCGYIYEVVGIQLHGSWIVKNKLLNYDKSK